MFSRIDTQSKEILTPPSESTIKTRSESLVNEAHENTLIPTRQHSTSIQKVIDFIETYFSLSLAGACFGSWVSPTRRDDSVMKGLYLKLLDESLTNISPLPALNIYHTFYLLHLARTLIIEELETKHRSAVSSLRIAYLDYAIAQTFYPKNAIYNDESNLTYLNAYGAAALAEATIYHIEYLDDLNVQDIIDIIRAWRNEPPEDETLEPITTTSFNNTLHFFMALKHLLNGVSLSDFKNHFSIQTIYHQGHSETKGSDTGDTLDLEELANQIKRTDSVNALLDILCETIPQFHEATNILHLLYDLQSYEKNDALNISRVYRIPLILRRLDDESPFDFGPTFRLTNTLNAIVNSDLVRDVLLNELETATDESSDILLELRGIILPCDDLTAPLFIAAIHEFFANEISVHFELAFPTLNPQIRKHLPDDFDMSHEEIMRLSDETQTVIPRIYTTQNDEELMDNLDDIDKKTLHTELVAGYVAAMQVAITITKKRTTKPLLDNNPFDEINCPENVQALLQTPEANASFQEFFKTIDLPIIQDEYSDIRTYIRAIINICATYFSQNKINLNRNADQYNEGIEYTNKAYNALISILSITKTSDFCKFPEIPWKEQGYLPYLSNRHTLNGFNIGLRNYLSFDGSQFYIDIQNIITPGSPIHNKRINSITEQRFFQPSDRTKYTSFKQSLPLFESAEEAYAFLNEQVRYLKNKHHDYLTGRENLMAFLEGEEYDDTFFDAILHPSEAYMKGITDEIKSSNLTNEIDISHYNYNFSSKEATNFETLFEDIKREKENREFISRLLNFT